MRLIRILVAGLIVVGVPILTATAAHATIKGPCSASGTINGKTYNAKQASVVILAAATCTGRAPSARPAAASATSKARCTSSSHRRSERSSSETAAGTGRRAVLPEHRTYHYDLPSVLVGPKFTLFGHHAERGTVVCTAPSTYGSRARS